MNAQQTLHAVTQSSDVEVFIVGGYVRDRLLGRECKDHDFVVTGATPELMIECGFQRVGVDFPVFLAPNGDEFALARVERKSGEGYNGFNVTTEEVLLEDDLHRRDLTINAMARRVLSFNHLGHAKLDDEIIDPFGGQAHLAIGALVHVSEAFAEDPLRVLRVARFAARYGFDVGASTLELMRDIVEAGEMQTLTPERVWQETSGAMLCDHPHLFWQTLVHCGAFTSMFRGVDDRRFMLNAALSTKIAANEDMRFAILLHDQNPQFVSKFFRDMKAPTDVKRAAEKVNRLWMESSSFNNLTAPRVMHILNAVDAFRRSDEFHHVLTPCMSVLDRRFWMADISTGLALAQLVTFDSLTDEERSTLKGRDIKDRLTELQIGLIGNFLINTNRGQHDEWTATHNKDRQDVH